MLITFITGLGVGFSLIIAIGAQNAFVLRQGLRNEHVGLVSLVCALSDAILISLGIAGFSLLSSQAERVALYFRYFGAIFLVIYGAFAFYRAFTSEKILESDTKEHSASLSATLAICLALTWLNPHVYLDTVILVGSISSAFPDKEWVFGAGAICASFIFFFSLGFGARLLRQIFIAHRSWQILELLVGCVMWLIAFNLLFAY